MASFALWLAAWLVVSLGVLSALPGCEYVVVAVEVLAAIAGAAKSIGIFHPFADAGGGGERVLWAAVQALQESHPDLQIVLYAGGTTDPTTLAALAMQQFRLAVAPSFRVVPVLDRESLLPSRHPRFTMAGQAAASVVCATRCLSAHVPGLWLDTTGWAFPYPLVALAGSVVAAYVHYPTVSVDMLRRVAAREPGFNNGALASSRLGAAVKLAYYGTMAGVYAACGCSASCVMANSSWTRRHIAAAWPRHRAPALVYPPCNTETLQKLPLSRRLKRLFVVSVSQFRPEKQHALQLKAFARAKRLLIAAGDSDAVCGAQLKLVGSCRNAEDAARVDALRTLAKELGVADSVEFCVNIPFEHLAALLGEAVAGLHTMRDEHFGIGVVELMAAGIVPIVHDSGGPREDIVRPEPATAVGAPDECTGFRCVTEQDYTDALMRVLRMDQLERMTMAAAARRRASRFSDANFKSAFLAALASHLSA